LILNSGFQAAYPLIDRLLESAQPSDKLTTFGDMIGATDCIAFPESSQFLVSSGAVCFIIKLGDNFNSLMLDPSRVFCRDGRLKLWLCYV